MDAAVGSCRTGDSSRLPRGSEHRIGLQSRQSQARSPSDLRSAWHRVARDIPPLREVRTMNSVELLLDLVRIAEVPLYSSYCWLGGQFGCQLSLGEFLRLVEDLLARDVLRLWEIDPQSHDRTELFAVPEGLKERYRSVGELDGRFDPFGLSLTLGASAQVDVEPSWEIDLDFE